MKYLWILFIAGQILNAGNMNYQQEIGLSEINRTVYSEHPTANQIYKTKAIECIAVYGFTKLVPELEKPILIMANVVVWGMIYSDYKRGIALRVNF